MDLALLVVALLVILAGAELFTNGIEWFGRKLELAEGAVGSVLAAVGTALPETMIPVIAIGLGTGEASNEIGIGAILGAPFMLATLAMFVTGAGVLAFRRRRPTGTTMAVDLEVLVHDVRWFAIAYGLAVGAAFLPPDLAPLKMVVAAALLVMYGWYVKQHFDAEAAEEAEALSPLRLHRFDRAGHRVDPHVPRLRVVNAQVVLALACIIGGAYLFVGAVERVAESIGVSQLLLALVIAPVATELPEKFNSLIWVRQGKDTLALGNITGAMVFQSAIPTVVALLFAGGSWAVTGGSTLAFASAGIAFLSIGAVFLPAVRRRVLDARMLLAGGAFYVAYLVLVGLEVTGVL